MITERPLKEVPTKALYALHRGIEGQAGLENSVFHDNWGPECLVCALGAMGTSYEKAMRECIKYGFFNTDVTQYYHTDVHTLIGINVESLNNKFEGTPEQRREFMLRHIVEELRHRGKSVETLKFNDGSKNAGASYVDKFVKDFHNLDV